MHFYRIRNYKHEISINLYSQPLSTTVRYLGLILDKKEKYHENLRYLNYEEIKYATKIITLLLWYRLYFFTSDISFNNSI